MPGTLATDTAHPTAPTLPPRPPEDPPVALGHPQHFGGRTIVLATALGEPRALRPGADFTAAPQARRAGEAPPAQDPLPDRGWLIRLNGPVDLKAGEVVILKQPGDAQPITAAVSAAQSFPRGTSRALVLSRPAPGLPSDDCKLQPVFMKVQSSDVIAASVEGAGALSSQTVRIPTLPKPTPISPSHTVAIPTLPRIEPAPAPMVPAPAPVRIVPRAPLTPAPSPLAAETHSWLRGANHIDTALSATAAVTMLVAASFAFTQSVTLSAVEAGVGLGLAALAWVLSERSKTLPSVSPARR